MAESDNPLFRKRQDPNDGGATEHFVKKDRESGAAGADPKEEALKRHPRDKAGNRAEHFTEIERRSGD